VSSTDPQTVTRLLHRWRQGDSKALYRLMPVVYNELHRIASRLMRGERPGHTLQATALVHEAYGRLVGGQVAVVDRVHFMSLAARVMRRILVDHARGRRRDKRGGGAVPVTLVELEAVSPGSLDRLLDIDDALGRLEAMDRRKHQALEMSVFGGMTQAEIAEALAVSVPTIERDLRMARAWLRTELGGAVGWSRAVVRSGRLPAARTRDS
jgi:RNA polymerase sigma factor (TIGR02999 family)